MGKRSHEKLRSYTCCLVRKSSDFTVLICFIACCICAWHLLSIFLGAGENDTSRLVYGPIIVRQLELNTSYLGLAGRTSCGFRSNLVWDLVLLRCALFLQRRDGHCTLALREVSTRRIHTPTSTLTSLRTTMRRFTTEQTEPPTKNSLLCESSETIY